MDRVQNSIVLAGALDGPASPDRAGSAASTRASRDEVFALVYRQMRQLAGRRDVDELAQTAAEQVLRSLPSFEGRSQLATWTFRICYVTLRKQERWYRRWMHRFTLTESGELPEQAAEEPAGEEAIERRERLARLQSAMQTLSAKRRTVLVLHDIEGMSVDEIAGIVGARPRAVRSRLRDARQALARALATDPYFGDAACTKGGEP